MFVGRDQELQTLERLYQQNNFQMVVLYGRRRIGKTTLISQFIQNRSAIFFTAQEANDTINLRAFSKLLYQFFKIPENTGAFVDWNTAFEFLAEQAQNQQIILAFDEFPYAAEANKSLKSILQNCIDHKLKNTKLFLILCGSHIGFMENEVLGYKSPLFGRRTAQIKLEAFDYYDASKMLSGFNLENRIQLYSCIGGTPHYLAQINPQLSFEENIKNLYFDISGYLYNEPMMLLQQELREPAMYNSIIAAIASGANRLNDIANRINEDSSKVIKYLQTLTNLRIVKKNYPYGENPASSRKGIYLVADYSYLFWYRFVFPHLSEIEQGIGSLVFENEVLGEQLYAYIGKPPFEDICMQYMKRLNRNQTLPFLATSIGTWWGNDPLERKQTDIDMVLANQKTKQAIFGECKWKNSFNDVLAIQTLLNKKNLLPEFTEKWFYFFSKIPYSDDAKSLANANSRVHLITAEMLFDRLEK